MGDHDHRAILGQLRERALDEGLVFGIGKRRGLVEHHDRRVLKDRARKGDALHLATRQIRPAGAQVRVEALRQLRHDVVALRGAQRGRHLLARSIGPGCAHVFLKRAAEQPVGLEDERDLVHKLMRVGIAHVHAADEHTPGGCVPEAWDQACARRLAAARRPHECKGRAGGDLEAHVVKRVGFGALIGERYVLEAHVTALDRAWVRGGF